MDRAGCSKNTAPLARVSSTGRVIRTCSSRTTDRASTMSLEKLQPRIQGTWTGTVAGHLFRNLLPLWRLQRSWRVG